MAEAEDLRAKGFRRVSATFPNKTELLNITTNLFHYDSVEGIATWLRLSERRRDRTATPALTISPAIRRADVQVGATYDFLSAYRRSKYAQQQDTITPARAALMRRVERATAEAEPFRRFHGLIQALSFSNPRLLRSLLEDTALPAFFEWQPGGTVYAFVLNDAVDDRFGLLRAGYALSHYPAAELPRDRGFAALTHWDRGLPIDYLEATLSILQAATYPYIPMVHGGPFGLSFAFLFQQPLAVELERFPRSWMHWTRSGSEFGLEDLDAMEGFADPEADLGRRLAHRRYMMAAPLSMAAFSDLLLWAITSLGRLLQEIPDPANFELDGDIDFVFALEHNLSMVRLFRRAVQILASEEPPSGKLAVFEMADLLHGLVSAFKGRPAGDAFFKLLFNPPEARALFGQHLRHIPASCREVFFALVNEVYGEIEAAVRGSIWVEGKLRGDHISVRSQDLTHEREETTDPSPGHSSVRFGTLTTGIFRGSTTKIGRRDT